VAAHALPVSYRAGEVIFRQGDPGLGFFVVVSGRVSIAHGGTEAAQLGAGGFFGEMALLDSYPRSATVTALDDTRCLSVKRSDFVRELRAQPDLALQILAILSKRVRDLDERIRQLQTSLPAEWLT
jgi:CRP-like cAMP-binding protein